MSYSVRRSLCDMNCPDGTVEKYDQSGNVYCVDEDIADLIYHDVTYPCPGIMVPFVDAGGNEYCICPVGYQPSGDTCVLSTSSSSSGGGGGGSVQPVLVRPTPVVPSKASLPTGIVIVAGVVLGAAVLSALL